MTIVGFSFTKMHVEKGEPAKGKIDIRNNVKIQNVEETDLSIGKSKQTGLKFTFEFTSNYNPNVGSILFNGEVIFLDDPSKISEVLKEWKKVKKTPKDVSTEVLNAVLQRCNVEALILSRDINLPPPIPMPKIQAAAEQ